MKQSKELERNVPYIVVESILIRHETERKRLVIALCASIGVAVAMMFRKSATS